MQNDNWVYRAADCANTYSFICEYGNSSPQDPIVEATEADTAMETTSTVSVSTVKMVREGVGQLIIIYLPME